MKTLLKKQLFGSSKNKPYICPTLQTGAMSVSVLSLTGVAYDRYQGKMISQKIALVI